MVSGSPAYQSKPSATWKETLTVNALSPKGLKTDGLMMRHYGMMPEPLTGDPGVDTWLLLLRDSRVNLTAWQASAAGQLTNGISGQTPLESFGTWDRDSCCWRTFQGSLLTGMAEPWSGSFPKSGMTVSGAAYQLRQLGRRIFDGDGGVWPTPTPWEQAENMGSWLERREREKAKGRNGNGFGTPLDMAVKMWPTPQSHDAVTGNPSRAGRFGTKHGGRNLNDEVLWRTPDSYSQRGAPVPVEQRKSGGHSVNLQDQVGGQLNPIWVEWLMGLPIGWTALEPLETESYQQWWQSFCATEPSQSLQGE